MHTDQRLSTLRPGEISTPLFTVGKMIQVFQFLGSIHAIRSWATDGLIDPIVAGLRKDRVYSVKDAITCEAMRLLCPGTSRLIASKVARMIGDKAVDMLKEEYDWNDGIESERLPWLIYSPVMGGTAINGLFIDPIEVQSYIGGNTPEVPLALDVRLFPAGEMIGRTLIDFVDWRDSQAKAA